MAVLAARPGDGTRIYKVETDMDHMKGRPLYIIAKTPLQAMTAHLNRVRETVRNVTTAKAVGTIELMTALKEVGS